MRKEGFERWAGKQALKNMARTRRTLDWATGQKLTSVLNGVEEGNDAGDSEDEKKKVVEEYLEGADDTEDEVSHDFVLNIPFFCQ